MNSPVKIIEAKNAVFQKIGRNIVNFQKMEKMLKVLDAHCEVSAPLSDLDRIRRTARKIERQPMGVLADHFVRSAYSDEARVPGEAENSRDIWISYSIRFELSGSSGTAAREALAGVIEERNLLIDQWLFDLDPGSIDSCTKLSDQLDAQHSRIWPQFEALALMIGVLKDHHEEIERYAESDVFIASVRDVTDD